MTGVGWVLFSELGRAGDE